MTIDQYTDEEPMGKDFGTDLGNVSRDIWWDLRKETALPESSRAKSPESLENRKPLHAPKPDQFLVVPPLRFGVQNSPVFKEMDKQKMPSEEINLKSKAIFCPCPYELPPPPFEAGRQQRWMNSE